MTGSGVSDKELSVEGLLFFIATVSHISDDSRIPGEADERTRFSQ